MEFSANIYYFNILLLGLPFLLTPIIGFFSWIKKNDFAVLKNKIKLILLFIPVIILIFIGSEICKIKLVLDFIDSNKITESGVIENIEQDLFASRIAHDYEGDVFSDVISIDGVDYLIITSGELEVGDNVEFTYLSYSKAILKIEIIE
jgi:hypothetical protein